jgi:hypothetical protein
MTRSETIAALDAHRELLVSLIAHDMRVDEAWRYAQKTLDIACSCQTFRDWWHAQPGWRAIIDAKFRATGHRAAMLQHERRAAGVMPDIMLAAPMDAGEAMRWPVRAVSTERLAELEAKVRARKEEVGRHACQD